MSSTGFTFPPPPPPPPKRDFLPGTSYSNYGPSSRGGAFNRGNDRGGGYRGRGRGSSGLGPRGNSAPRGRGQGYPFTTSAPSTNNFGGHQEWPQGYLQRGGTTQSRPGSYYNQATQHRGSTSSRGSLELNAPQKRDHATAFNHSGRGGSKPLAAPAVPSFLSDIPGLPSSVMSTATSHASKSPSEKKSKPRTSNVLGLNPSIQDPESEEDDENEEAKLATAAIPAQGLVAIEYGGQVSTLKTPTEIAAWLTERRKRFPTAAKAEEAKKAAAEKKQKREETMRAQQETRRLKRDKEEQERKAGQDARRLQKMIDQTEKEKAKSKVEGWMQTSKPTGSTKEADAAEKARLKATKLLKKAEKAQKQLQRAQEKLRKTQAASQIGDKARGHNGVESVDATQHHQLKGSMSDTNDSASSSIISDTDSDDEDTSSSGSSSSSSSSSECPETQPTHATGPQRVPPPPRPRPVPIKIPANTCRNMLRFGICRNRRQCPFSHENPAEGVGIVTDGRKKKVEVSAVTGRPKRKSLYEVMVQKEKEEEARVVLGAIVHLGKEGLWKSEGDR